MRNNHETTRQQNNKLPSEPTPNHNQTKQNQDTPPPWHMARISPILTQAFSVSVLVPVSTSALVSVLSQYPLLLQSLSVLDPRLCQRPPPTSTHASCLTTPNIPYCPCLPCNDPCLSDIATTTNKTSVILPELGLVIGSSVRLPDKNRSTLWNNKKCCEKERIWKAQNLSAEFKVSENKTFSTTKPRRLSNAGFVSRSCWQNIESLIASVSAELCGAMNQYFSCMLTSREVCSKIWWEIQ